MATVPNRVAPLATLLALLMMSGACTGPHPSDPVKPATEEPAVSDPASPLPSRTGSSAPRLEALGPAPADLHDVDWTNTPIPGEFCAVPGLVRFDAKREARANSKKWGPARLVLGKNVIYGDIDTDNRDEAAVYVGCGDDRGGNEQFTAAYLVFTHAGDGLAVLGSVTPQQNPPGPYPTALAELDFAPGRIVAHEKWWRTTDAHCCPSGNATTIWTRERNRLTPGDPRITT